MNKKGFQSNKLHPNGYNIFRKSVLCNYILDIAKRVQLILKHVCENNYRVTSVLSSVNVKEDDFCEYNINFYPLFCLPIKEFIILLFAHEKIVSIFNVQYYIMYTAYIRQTL